MSRFRTITVDNNTNLLNNPVKSESAAERQQADKASKGFGAPAIQLKPPSVTKVVAHDPVHKFLLGTRFVPLKSLGLHIPNLTLDFEPERRYSIDPTINTRYSILLGRRRYRLLVEGTFY